MAKKVNIAIVGLNFGSLFVPSYKFHPNIGEITICDFKHDLVKRVGDCWTLTGSLNVNLKI